MKTKIPITNSIGYLYYIYDNLPPPLQSAAVPVNRPLVPVNPEGPGAIAVDLPVIHLWLEMHETLSVSSA
jgi:hypothetical protein